MESQKHCFVIITYHPKVRGVERLVAAVAPYQTYLVDTTEEEGIRFEQVYEKSIPQYATLLTMKKNLGYAGGAIVGMKQALKDGFEWVTILNDDMRMSHNTVEDYVKKLEGVPQGIAGIYPRYLDPVRYSSLLQPEVGRVDLSCDFLSGSCISIHRDVFSKIGLLYEPYFMYYEDAEYCLRAKLAGFPLTPIVLRGVEHDESSSIQRGSFLHQYYLARNHMLFVERNAPIPVKLHEIARMPKTLFEHYKRRERGAIRGISDYAIRRFGRLQGAI